ncbi:MAG: Fur family transcriptional regulator [Verrucomicrobiota bacterium]
MTSSKIYDKAITYLTSIRAHITSQRKIIIQKAFTPPSHYTAEELLKSCQKADRSISRATVYRTLALLVKSGLLNEIDLKRGSNTKCYDFNYIASPEHSHIVCADCGKVFEFDDPCLSVRKNIFLEKLGFKAKIIRLRIEASCLKFASGKCPHKKSKKKKTR